MARSSSPLQVEPNTFQVASLPQRLVIQEVEMEAERLLLRAGGKVLKGREGYVYEEYLDDSFPSLVVYWPQETHSVYLSAQGQEDGPVIFVAALLPDGESELHLTYDYRPWGVSGSFEEFFTLRVAVTHVIASKEGE